jgi:hypothetical protein
VQPTFDDAAFYTLRFGKLHSSSVFVLGTPSSVDDADELLFSENFQSRCQIVVGLSGRVRTTTVDSITTTEWESPQSISAQITTHTVANIDECW